MSEYVFTMDVLPQQTEEQNKLYKFYDHLHEGRLTTTKCEDCDTISWPPRTVCPECVSDHLVWIDLPKTAIVLAYTEQYAGNPPGFESPLCLAQLDMGSGIHIISRVQNATPGAIKIGDELELRVNVLPDGRVIHAFQPKLG